MAEVAGFLLVIDDDKHQLDLIHGPLCQPKTGFQSERTRIDVIADTRSLLRLNVIDLTRASMFAFRRGKEQKQTEDSDGRVCPAK